MREISWDDFYERFFDWAESTRRTRIGDLTGYGPADEVYDIAMELSYDDDRTAARFLGRAAEAGVRFTPEQILEFALIVDEKTLGRMAKAADPAFTVRELEEIEPLLSEADFAARKSARRGQADAAAATAPIVRLITVTATDGGITDTDISTGASSAGTKGMADCKIRRSADREKFQNRVLISRPEYDTMG